MYYVNEVSPQYVPTRVRHWFIDAVQEELARPWQTPPQAGTGTSPSSLR